MYEAADDVPAVGPNGFRCYVNDTLLPDGRPISAHCVMAALDGNLATLAALVDPLTEQQTRDLLSLDHWAGVTLLDVVSGTTGDVEKIAYLVGKGADVNGQHYESEKTCLHLAAAGGKAPAVQLLVETLRANPFALDRNGQTPFANACVTGDSVGHLAGHRPAGRDGERAHGVGLSEGTRAHGCRRVAPAKRRRARI